MNIDELVSRINELSKKSKEIGLTDEEKKGTASFKKRLYRQI